VSFVSYPLNRTEELPKQSLHRCIVLHLFRLGAISAPFWWETSCFAAPRMKRVWWG